MKALYDSLHPPAVDPAWPCPASESEDTVRLRVRARIMQRVRELERGGSTGEQSRALQSPPHLLDAGADTPPSNAEKALEYLRHDVIDVAAQILERCLQQRSAHSKAVDHSLELRLVHRMLAKESELLALQSLLPQPRAVVNTATNNNK